MCKIPLTPEQQLFAAENHNLVYKFLNAKHLSVDEYYDIIIFGYINSVHRFFATPGLSKYAFGSIAWKGMQNSLYNHNRAIARKKRNAEICSIHNTSYTDDLSLEEVLPSSNNLLQQLETELILHDLARHVSQQQMDIVRMRSSGYNLQDIANHHNTSIKRIRRLLEEVRSVLMDICYE